MDVEIFRYYFASTREYTGSLDAVFELAYVAGPVIFFERADGLLCYLQRHTSQLPAILRCKELRKLSDVGSAFSERRDIDREDREPEVKIFSKLPRAHRCFQVPVGRGDDPDVHFNVSRPAKSIDLPFLEHSQQLRLYARSDLAYLVEEDRAACRELELTRAPLVRTGIGALLVAKQFVFNQRVGYGCAVDCNERRITPRAEVVNSAGKQLFAGARLAEQQNCRTSACHLLNLPSDFLHRLRIPDDARKPVTSRVLVSQQDIFSAKPGFIQRTLYQKEQVSAVDRLLQKLVSALFHRLHG